MILRRDQFSSLFNQRQAPSPNIVHRVLVSMIESIIPDSLDLGALLIASIIIRLTPWLRTESVKRSDRGGQTEEVGHPKGAHARAHLQ